MDLRKEILQIVNEWDGQCLDLFAMELNTLFNEKMKGMAEKYKDRVSKLRKKQDLYEAKGQAGACIATQGEIQAYNAVIKEMENLIHKE